MEERAQMYLAHMDANVSKHQKYWRPNTKMISTAYCVKLHHTKQHIYTLHI